MAYRLKLHRDAEKFLDSLPKQERERIRSRMDGLLQDPRPSGCIKLTAMGQNSWRIRVGDFRVLYQILEQELLIWVFEIARRNERTYKP